MAKSTGNVVNPFFAIDRFGVDVMRFYLGHDGGISQDSDYSNEYIIERYKKALQGGLGNLASRITRGKGWKVRHAVAVHRDFGDLKLGKEDLLPFSEHAGILKHTPANFASKMDNNEISEAIKVVMYMIHKVNSKIRIIIAVYGVRKADNC